MFPSTEFFLHMFLSIFAYLFFYLNYFFCLKTIFGLFIKENLDFVLEYLDVVFPYICPSSLLVLLVRRSTQTKAVRNLPLGTDKD